MITRPKHPLRKKWKAKIGDKERKYSISRLQQLDACADESAQAVLLNRIVGLKGKNPFPPARTGRSVTEQLAREIATLSERITGDVHYIDRIEKSWAVYREDTSGKKFRVL